MAGQLFGGRKRPRGPIRGWEVDPRMQAGDQRRQKARRVAV